MTGILDHAFALLQHLLPQRALTRCAGVLARAETPWLKNALIRAFARGYRVDMSEAAQADPTAYPTFNAFFTRPLAPGLRPMPDSLDALACPVDGTVSEAGTLAGERLLQAKGHTYSVRALLGDDEALARRFRDGSYATIYLAPHNYHRIHMPVSGTLEQMLYVPGRLYSVNARTERAIGGLFARNERVICVFDTAAGALAVVLVGALIVGGMETAWHGEVRAPRGRIKRWRYRGAVRLERGAELGRFNVGSTVIVLCERGRVEWAGPIRAGARVRLGEPLGLARPK